jgi:hypothetical protein
MAVQMIRPEAAYNPSGTMLLQDIEAVLPGDVDHLCFSLTGSAFVGGLLEVNRATDSE